MHRNDDHNPFVDIESVLSTTERDIFAPKYTKSKIMGSYRLSEEAHARLQTLADTYSRGKISLLMEYIGLYALQVRKIDPDKKDDESQLTAAEFREMGYNDGSQGNNILFLKLFGENKHDDFFDNYMRGYLEGAFQKRVRG